MRAARTTAAAVSPHTTIKILFFFFVINFVANILTSVFLVFEHEFPQFRRYRRFRHVVVDGNDFVFGFADALQSPQPEQRFALVVGDQLVDASFLLGHIRPVDAWGPRQRFVVAFQRLQPEHRFTGAVVIGHPRRGHGVVRIDRDLTEIVG